MGRLTRRLLRGSRDIRGDRVHSCRGFDGERLLGLALTVALASMGASSVSAQQTDGNGIPLSDFVFFDGVLQDGVSGGTLASPNGPFTAVWQAQSGAFGGANWGGVTYLTGHIINQNCGEECGSISNVAIDGQVSFFAPTPGPGDTAVIASLAFGGPAPPVSPAAPGVVTYDRDGSGLSSPFTVTLGGQSVAVLGVISAPVATNGSAGQINPALSLGGTFTATSDADIGGYLTPIQIGGGGTLTTPILTLSGAVNVTGGTLHGDEVFIDNANVTDPAVAGIVATSTTATFSGAGAMLTAKNYLVVGDSTQGALVLTSGATASIQGGSGDVYIGNAAGSTGEIDVNQGSKLTTDGFVIVGDSGIGTLTVTGGQAQTGGVLVVGNGGGAKGTLNITEGGQVTSSASGGPSAFAGIVGTDSNSTIGSSSVGDVTISGAGSSWDVKESLSIGPYGTGTINVAAGGVLEVDGSDIFLGHNPSAVGKVVLDGGASKLVATSATLHVGYAGSGEIDVQNGATLDASGQSVMIGEQSTGNGTVKVNSGGVFNVANLTVGGSGVGELDVGSTDTGGTITTGTANITGDTLILGNNQGSRGAFVVEGASKINFSGLINDGVSGSGAVDLEDTAKLSIASAVLGVNATGAGKLTVGDNAMLTTTSDVTVGGAGGGIMNVQNGGSATIGGNLILAAKSGSTATVNVDGANAGTTNTSGLALGQSTLTVSGNLTVGPAGQGSVSVVNGAMLQVNGATTLGSIGVDGQVSGMGTLSVQGGSQATIAGSLQINGAPPSQPAVLVEGANSQLTVKVLAVSNGTVSVTNNATLVVLAGCGCIAAFVSAVKSSDELDVANSAVFKTPKLTIAGDSDAGPTGTLNVEQNGVTDVATTLGVGLGGIVDVSNGGSINVGSPAQLAAAGQIAIGAGGRLGLALGSPAQIGIANNTLPKVSGNVLVESGGSFVGMGIVNGNLTNNGGIVGAGASPDALYINGNYTQTGGTIDFEVDPDGHGGFLWSTLVLGAGDSVDITGADIVLNFLGGASPTQFAEEGLYNLDTFFREENADGANVALPSELATFTDITVTTNVPEPSTWAMMLLGFAGLGFAGYRRLNRAHERETVS
jgi:T5SS/PEP-CTERM-associated repeat protein